MRNFYSAIFSTLFLFILPSCADNASIRSADLVFVIEEETGMPEGNMSDAIIESTGRGGASATHVGIIEIADGEIYVIDASPRSGVSERTLDEFKKEFIQSDRSRCVIMRPTVPIDAATVVERAKSHIGSPYDFRFLPDNGSIYCSELVQLCYLESNGQSVFESKPMNFKGADGEYPEYWQSLFAELNVPIPQGVPGTNPTDMMHSAVLRPIR